MLQSSSSSASIPSLGLLALALTLLTYSLGQSGLVTPPAGSLGTVLLLGGGLQLMAGLQTRNPRAGAVFLPLGLFWLSLISFDVFPALGYGRHPLPVVMAAYLSMWGVFSALLFFASFRQSRALQLVFGALMSCLLLLALGKLTGNSIFLFSGGCAGVGSALAAGYTSLAQLCNQSSGRAVLPLGVWQNRFEQEREKPFVP